MADDGQEPPRAANAFAADAGGHDPQAKLRHDLRTPLNQIIGFSELLQEDAEQQGLQGFVADLIKIQAAARRQLELLNGFFSGDSPSPPASAVSVPASGAAGEAEFPGEDTGGTSLPLEVQMDAGAPRRRDRLLVVDDNETNRDMLSRRLSTRGFDVTVAEDGGRALAIIEEKEFDLVLLDWMMPGMNGLEVLNAIRQKYSVADLPVIMVTALSESDNIVEALKAGANDYVTKPLDFPVVRARIKTHLALKRAKDEAERLAELLEHRNRFIRNTFGRYVSNEVVASVLESPGGLNLGGEKRKVTILMSDLRGFTALAERLAPEKVVTLLNNYLGIMADVIMSYGGTIDEFIGDAILAIFGAPMLRDDDAERAVACAVEMQLAIDLVNGRNRSQGLPAVEMGISVNTGEVVVGNIGSQKRTKYGVVGPPVNLTSRIESYTVGGQILISDSTLAEVRDIAQVGSQVVLTVKGSQKPVTVHDLSGIGGRHNLSLPAHRQDYHFLPHEIPVLYSILEDKLVGGAVFEGTLVKLASHAGTLRSDSPLAPHTGLKMKLFDLEGGEIPGDLYAKVIEHAGDSSACFSVCFTSVPPAVSKFLDERLAAAAAAPY